MTRATHSPLYVTKELFETRYQGAEAIFVAGSVVRGEASTYSDLDLVVLFPQVEAAYRESFMHKGWPVEAFIHDAQTIRYFFNHIDGPDGSGTLASMIAEGHEMPGPTAVTENLKSYANQVIREGPPALTAEDLQDRRYHITELIDDIREPRNRPELIATATAVYTELADYYFRTRRAWAGSGKSLLKRMKQIDSSFARRFTEAFDLLFTSGQSAKVIEIAEDLLKEDGGFLFDGYRREAPAQWRGK